MRNSGVHHFGGRHPATLDVDTASIDPGHVQDFVEQSPKPFEFAACERGLVALFFLGELTGLEIAQSGADGRHRRADAVTQRRKQGRGQRRPFGVAGTGARS